MQAETPQTDMLRANQGLRLLSHVASPGRLGRPLAFVRIPGMEMIDRFYYSNENVDQRTVARRKQLGRCAQDRLLGGVVAPTTGMRPSDHLSKASAII